MLVFLSDVTLFSPMKEKKNMFKLNNLMDDGRRYKLFTFLLVNQNKLEIFQLKRILC